MWGEPGMAPQHTEAAVSPDWLLRGARAKDSGPAGQLEQVAPEPGCGGKLGAAAALGTELMGEVSAEPDTSRPDPGAVETAGSFPPRGAANWTWQEDFKMRPLACVQERCSPTASEANCLVVVERICIKTLYLHFRR